jgi:Matrixin
LTGTSSIGALRSSIDSAYGSGAFNAAVQRAFNTWTTAANLKFVQVADNGAAFAGTTAIDIRIGAYAFNGGFEGGVGYGPPGNDLFFPDPLAGDIAFAANNNFQIASGAEGALLPRPGGAYSNDIEGLMLHELGHALGLGHSTNPYAVMCGYVNSAFDGSACHYELINRQLDADDIAGMQFLYGASLVSQAGDAPLPAWAAMLLGMLLLATLGWHAPSSARSRQRV